MKKLFTLIALFIVISVTVSAQSQPFGKVDTVDLKLTTCDFEKGANAMVLFDITDINTGYIISKKYGIKNI